MMVNRALQIEPTMRLDALLAGGEIVALNVGPEGHIYLVIALAPFDRVEHANGDIFPETASGQPRKYRVVALSKKQIVLDVVIADEQFEIHHAQPLGADLLLVCARSSCGGGLWDIEENGRLYTRDGQFKRGMVLGDGIQSVQTTAGGIIWTSFFDEGVFGDEPIGESGLVGWDAQGNKCYEFHPPEELSPIYDCYALNVVSEEDVWCYYYARYPQNPLVHIHHRTVAAFWDVPTWGHALAVSASHALFRNHSRNTYSLLSLGTHGHVKQTAEIRLQDHRGNNLAIVHEEGRADAIHFISGGCLYRIDMQTLIPFGKG